MQNGTTSALACQTDLEDARRNWAKNYDKAKVCDDHLQSCSTTTVDLRGNVSTLNAQLLDAQNQISVLIDENQTLADTPSPPTPEACAEPAVWATVTFFTSAITEVVALIADLGLGHGAAEALADAAGRPVAEAAKEASEAVFGTFPAQRALGALNGEIVDLALRKRGVSPERLPEGAGDRLLLVFVILASTVWLLRSTYGLFSCFFCCGKRGQKNLEKETAAGAARRTSQNSSTATKPLESTTQMLMKAPSRSHVFQSEVMRF